MSLFEKFAMTPRQERRHRRRYTGTFDRGARYLDEDGLCPDCHNGIDESTDLCVNARCPRSSEDGWTGSGWATHPNNRP